MWILRLLLWIHRYGQSEHLNGFSPVWVNSWFFNWKPNKVAMSIQTAIFSNVFTFVYSTSFPQYLQLTPLNFWPVWVASCFFTYWDEYRILPQYEQGYCFPSWYKDTQITKERGRFSYKSIHLVDHVFVRSQADLVSELFEADIAILPRSVWLVAHEVPL